jgi:hypothetical protein
MPRGHGGHGGHGGGGGHHGSHGRGGSVAFGPGWWGPDVVVVDELLVDEDDLGSSRRATPPPRDFDESAAAAHRRAERDPATRARITYAHEAVARSLLGHPSHAEALRRQGPARHTQGSRRAVRNAGLTMGEAEAAGVVKR